LKKHISILIALIIVLSLFGGGIQVAKAAGVNVKITGTTELAALGATTLKVTVTNDTDADIPAGCVLKQNGTEYATFEQIPMGMTSEEQTFSYNVTAFGTVTFQLYDSSNTEIGSATVTFTQKELTVAINATFDVSPSELVAKDDIITLNFKIENQGEAPLTDINVKIPGVNGGKALNTSPFSVSPGKTKTLSYQYTVSSAMTLTPAITYKANGTGDTLTYNPDPIELIIENRKVDLTFTVSNPRPNAGEEVTFTADVTNNGNVSYSGVEAYINGEKVAFPSSKLTPNAHYTKDYTMSFVASTKVTFLLTLTDNKGEIVNVEKSVSISLPIDENEIANSLTMTVEVDRPSLTSAGTVNFTGHITNATDYSLSQLTVMETTQNIEAYNNEALSSYGTASFEYSTNISETTTFNFVLTVTDTEGVTHAIDPVAVEVTITSAPAGTEFENAVDITPSPTAENDEKTGLGLVPIIAIVLAVLILAVGAALVVLWRQQRSGSSPSRPTRPTRPGGGSGSVKKHPKGSSLAKRKPASKGYRDRNSF